MSRFLCLSFLGIDSFCLFMPEEECKTDNYLFIVVRVRVFELVLFRVLHTQQYFLYIYIYSFILLPLPQHKLGQ